MKIQLATAGCVASVLFAVVVRMCKQRCPMSVRACSLALATAFSIGIAFVQSGFSASSPIKKPQRDLVIFNYLNTSDDLLYAFLEESGVSLAQVVLGPQYRQVHVVKGKSVTFAAFRDKLKSVTAHAAVQAVDVVFSLHGGEDSVLFADGARSDAQVGQAIQNALPESQRKKLKMIFNTSCYGATHRDGFRAAGFDVVSGSKKISADGASSYGPFLTAWATGASFSSAVGAANKASSAKVVDNAVTTKYGAGNVDSTRVISGKVSLTIASWPKDD